MTKLLSKFMNSLADASTLLVIICAGMISLYFILYLVYAFPMYLNWLTHISSPNL